MPSKKKKYNARFPPARIKKIMQSDEEVGKVAQAVPVIISRALELFVESLLTRAETVTQGRNAKTLTPSHLKQCIMAEQRFDFLKDLVSAIPDVQGDEDGGETPRSSTSNTPFDFPAVTLPVHSTATASSSSTSASVITSAPTAVIRDLHKESQRPSSSATATITSSSAQEPSLVERERYHSQAPQLSLAVGDNYQIQRHHESVIVSHSSILNPPRINSNPYIPSLAQHQQVHQHQIVAPPPLSHFEYLPTNLQLAATMENNGFGLIDGSRMPHPLSLSLRGSSSMAGRTTFIPGSTNSNSPGVIVYEKGSSSTSSYKEEPE